MDRSISARHWLAQLGVVLALTASEVAIAAVAGISGARLALLSIAAVVFALGYLITPSPGKCHYDAQDLNPVLAMMGAVVGAIALTGGITSPMLALLPAPLLVGWTMFGTSREGIVLGALVPLVLVGVLTVPASWTTVEIDRTGFAMLAAWTTLLSSWMIGRRIRRMFASHREIWSSLDRVRNGALSDAESRRRGLESMSTKLAHELKNPLAAIKSLVQLESRGATDDKTKRRLDVVFAEAERMESILRDYLSFARPSDAMCVATLELSDLMAEIEALLAGRAEAAGVELSLNGRGGSLVADPRLLKEAIVNVASNALEATPRGGTVDVTYHVGSAGASIVVRDTGVGMTREVSNRIGTPFFTTRDGGTGLGVVIARSAIAQHRGTLVYNSTPGIGTIATIALPRDACPAAGAIS
ncbi:MAG: Sensor histidine kinase [Myxococcales bacterium]|nr:Sensor histidine kinase [Myxococcales bacterium]